MKKSLFIILFCAITTYISAQTGLLGYGSKAVMPSQMANPAMTGNIKSHIAFPIISSIQVERNASFKLTDWLTTEEGKTYINLNKFANSALDRNDLNTNIGIDVFSLGMSVGKKVYVSAGYQHFTNVYSSFSDDLVKFLAEGNATNTNISLNEESVYVNQFNAAYAGGSVSLWKDKISLGARVKMLQGISNFQTNDINLNIVTDATTSPAYALKVSGDMQVQAGGIFGVLLDTVLNKNAGETIRQNLTSMGKGVGFDFGVTVKATDKLTLGASAINIGNITWKKELAQKMDFVGSGKFEFAGIATNLNNTNAGTNKADSVEQKFKEAFDIQQTKEAYSSKLPTLIYASANYKFSEKHQVTAVYRGQSFNGKSNSLVGLNYGFSPFKALQLLAGANMTNFKNMNFGAGLVFNPGPIQLHILADNISGLMAVDNTNRLQIQAGINIVLRKKTPTPATPTPEPTTETSPK